MAENDKGTNGTNGTNGHAALPEECAGPGAPGANGAGEPCDGLFLSAVADLPTHHGQFKVRVVRGPDRLDHVLVYKGDLEGREDVPVRVHSECLTSEVFHSMRCDCEQQLAAALDYFESHGFGALIYLRQEGRGIGLLNKINAYALQDTGLDTVEANVELGLPEDSRTYEMAVRCLEVLGIKSVRLLTNNPSKLDAFAQHNVQVTSRVPLHMKPNSFNDPYLKTKRTKMNHLL